MDTIRKVTAVLMILAALFLNGIGIDVPQRGFRFFLYGCGALLGYGAWELLRHRKVAAARQGSADGIVVEAESLKAALTRAADCGYISVAMLQRDAGLHYTQAGQLIEVLIDYDYASRGDSVGKTPVSFKADYIADIMDYLMNIKVLLPK